MPNYSTSTAVGILVGTTFSSATTPTDSAVASIIARVGQFVTNYTGQGWTVATATEYFDTFDEYRLSYSRRPESDAVQTIFHLKNRPIITIGTCQINIAGTWSENWQTQSSGYGHDFLIYKEEGYIEFIRWIPVLPWPGRRNVRVLYTYGYATVPSDIAYAVELLVAEEVLLIQNAGRPLISVAVGGAHYQWANPVQQAQMYHDKAMEILNRRGLSISPLWR